MASSTLSLDRLRSLRALAKAIGNVVDDLKPFLHEDKQTFRRLPTDSSTANEIRVTGTASCLVSLSLVRQTAGILRRELRGSVRKGVPADCRCPLAEF